MYIDWITWLSGFVIMIGWIWIVYEEFKHLMLGKKSQSQSPRAAPGGGGCKFAYASDNSWAVAEAIENVGGKVYVALSIVVRHPRC